MAPRPRKPPDEESEDFPPTWERVPHWLRCSERHPMVQSQPDEIINGTNVIINALRELRSPSPNAGIFSRFSSRATTLNNAVPGPSFQYPVYSYPPLPPQPSHRWGCVVSRGLAPVWIHNPPPISKTGSVRGASCRGAEPQYHQNINKKLGLYSVGNGLSK